MGKLSQWTGTSLIVILSATTKSKWIGFPQLQHLLQILLQQKSLQNTQSRMANFLCFSPISSFNAIDKPGLISHQYITRKPNWINSSSSRSKSAAFEALKATPTPDFKPSTKANSLLCADCEGEGNKKCGQCEGKGVNIVDHFNGRYKAGASCWLCRGKKEVLCGNCNGAGFIGGFMSTFDD